MNKLILVLISFNLLLNTGCATYITHKNWVEAKKEKAVRIDADGEHVLVGVDITAISYVKENWAVALGAAVLDAATAYGAYKLVDNIQNAINISGDNNTVYIYDGEVVNPQ